MGIEWLPGFGGRVAGTASRAESATAELSARYAIRIWQDFWRCFCRRTRCARRSPLASMKAGWGQSASRNRDLMTIPAMAAVWKVGLG
jgi:hypothetical protein